MNQFLICFRKNNSITHEGIHLAKCFLFSDLSKAKKYGYNPIVDMKDGLKECLANALEYFR